MTNHFSITFEQAATDWIKDGQKRKRRPFSGATTRGYQTYLNKINLLIGKLFLSDISNRVVKGLLSSLANEGYSHATIRHHFNVIKLVVASVVDENLETVFKREWNHALIDLPVVNASEQCRPSYTAEQVSAIMAEAEGQDAVLYAFLAGTGLRIGEATAVELGPQSPHSTTISGDCCTVYVRKSIWNGQKQKPKTQSAIRDVDIPLSLSAMIQDFIGNRREGFLFRTTTGTALWQPNFLRDHLHPLLGKLSLRTGDSYGTAFHSFRRYRVSHLRKSGCPWDLERLWIGHASKDITDKYAEGLRTDVEFRRQWAEKIGVGFDLAPSKQMQLFG